MSEIEWTDETVNFAVGCTRVSPGCERCYAERFVHRGLHKSHRGLTVMRKTGPGWTGEVRFLPERLTEPQRWKKAKRIFVNSLSDFGHPALTHEQRLAMCGALCMAPQHVYQILTKRPETLVDFERWLVLEGEREHLTFRELAIKAYCDAVGTVAHWRDIERLIPAHGHAWWIGVTAEDQQRADERIPKLLSLVLLPTKRFVSYEPALGPVDFTRLRDREVVRDDGRDPGAAAEWSCLTCDGALDWVIVGGESGPGARPFDVAWARSTIEQCRAAGVACFVKQLGAHVIDGMQEDVIGPDGSVHYTRPAGHPLLAEASARPGYSLVPHRVRLKHRKGADTWEWPRDLWVREFPR